MPVGKIRKRGKYEKGKLRNRKCKVKIIERPNLKRNVVKWYKENIAGV